MNINLKLVTIGIISALLFTGCTQKDDTKISTIDDNSSDIVVVNINENEDLEKQNQVKDYFLGEKTNEYTFNFKTLDSDKYTIEYPQIVNYKGELTMDYINQSIELYAKDLVSNTSDVLDGNKLTYTSEILSENNNFISIKFTGVLPNEGSAYNMTNAITIDLNSSNTITSSNIFTEDKTIINREFARIASEMNINPVTPENYMIMYIENKNLVFSYLANDMSTEYTEIKIPLESIIENLNIDFEEHPAS